MAGPRPVRNRQRGSIYVVYQTGERFIERAEGKDLRRGRGPARFTAGAGAGVRGRWMPEKTNRSRENVQEERHKRRAPP